MLSIWLLLSWAHSSYLPSSPQALCWSESKSVRALHDLVCLLTDAPLYPYLYCSPGNEADLYSSNGLRNASEWTVQDYVEDWESIADPVVEAAGIESRYEPVTLQGAAFASQAFTPREIFALGILNSTAGKTISTYVFHAHVIMQSQESA